MMRENKSYEKNLTYQALYDALMQSMIMYEDDIEKAKTVETPTQKKRRHNVKDQDPPVGPNQGLKKRKLSKDVELSKKPTSASSSKGDELGNTNEQPNVETVTKNDWVSRHDVYSTMRIMSVTSVTVDKWYGYGYLNEIVVRRSDMKLYKFMKGDFLRLYLNDIEDILLLVVQNKLFNLKGDEIIDLVVALRMYTCRIVIQKRVEDLQLGAKSYQKKLNISKPQTCNDDLSRRAIYTTLSKPQGIIYKDKLKKKRLMRTNELYKFSDGTLTSVHNTLD
nr:hypothetical protein [Tanacetum cinerariifolium]